MYPGLTEGRRKLVEILWILIGFPRYLSGIRVPWQCIYFLLWPKIPLGNHNFLLPNLFFGIFFLNGFFDPHFLFLQSITYSEKCKIWDMKLLAWVLTLNFSFFIYLSKMITTIAHQNLHLLDPTLPLKMQKNLCVNFLHIYIYIYLTTICKR